MYQPPYYQESAARGREGLGGYHQRMFAEALRQRQQDMLSGHHRAHLGMGSHSPFSTGGYGMSPMMGAYQRHGFPSPMGMGPGMGPGMGMGMSPGVGMGLGRSPFVRSPMGHERHSPFGFGYAGPPRAHSFRPQQHLRFSTPHQRHGPMIFDEEEDFYDDDYYTAPRHRHRRRMRGEHRFGFRHPSRRKSYRPGYFDDSEDDSDGNGDRDDDFDDEDELEGYYPRRRLGLQWRGY